MMNKVMISGASGFIGQALFDKLIKEGTKVYGLCNHPNKLPKSIVAANSRIIQAEFSDYKKLPRYIHEQDFDAFIHLAWQGYGTAKNDYAVQFANVTYSCDAVETAIACKCKRFIFVSSVHEFLKCKNSDGIAGRCSMYGVAKQAARNACQVIAHNRNVEFVGVWLDHVFGPGIASPRASNQLIQKMLNEGKVPLTDGKNLCDWIYISDCISGIVSASENGKSGKTYYIGGGNIRTFEILMKEVRDTVAPQAVLEFGKYPECSYVDYSEINTRLLYRDTGYTPTCRFPEGILNTAEWIQQGMPDVVV